MRKPRSDSRLKILPEDRQEQIARYAGAHSLENTKAWLAREGITTSEAALSVFLAWWQERRIQNRPYQIGQGCVIILRPCALSRSDIAVILSELDRLPST